MYDDQITPDLLIVIRTFSIPEQSISFSFGTPQLTAKGGSTNNLLTGQQVTIEV